MWYTYRINNLHNGNYYYGVRKCPEGMSPEEDPYMGSGNLVKAAIEKYGSSSFNKEIIQTFQTEELAFLHESQIVTQAEVLNPKCYNLCVGGNGGWGGPGKFNRWQGPHSESSKELNRQAALKRWKDGKYDKAVEKWQNGGRAKENNGFHGRRHTEAYKEERLDLWSQKNGCIWIHLETNEQYKTFREAKRKLGRYQAKKLRSEEKLVKVSI